MKLTEIEHKHSPIFTEGAYCKAQLLTDYLSIVRILSYQYDQPLQTFRYRVVIEKLFSDQPYRGIYREGEIIDIVEPYLSNLTQLERQLFELYDNNFSDLMVLSDGLLLRSCKIQAIEIMSPDCLEEENAECGLYIMTDSTIGEGLFALHNQECAEFLKRIPSNLLPDKFLEIIDLYETKKACLNKL